MPRVTPEQHAQFLAQHAQHRATFRYNVASCCASNDFRTLCAKCQTEVQEQKYQAAINAAMEAKYQQAIDAGKARAAAAEAQARIVPAPPGPAGAHPSRTWTPSHCNDDVHPAVSERRPRPHRPAGPHSSGERTRIRSTRMTGTSTNERATVKLAIARLELRRLEAYLQDLQSDTDRWEGSYEPEEDDEITPGTGRARVEQRQDVLDALYGLQHGFASDAGVTPALQRFEGLPGIHMERIVADARAAHAQAEEDERDRTRSHRCDRTGLSSERTAASGSTIGRGDGRLRRMSVDETVMLSRTQARGTVGVLEEDVPSRSSGETRSDDAQIAV